MVDEGTFLASSTRGRSCERPEHIVLRFHFANSRVGYFLLLLLLLGAWFTDCSSSFALSSKPPLEQPDCDGSTPYWLRAAHFEAGVS